MDCRIGFVLKGDTERVTNSPSEELGDILLPLCPDPWTELLTAGTMGTKWPSLPEQSTRMWCVFSVFTHSYFEVLSFSVFRLCCKCGTLVCLFCCDLFGEETQGNSCLVGAQRPHNSVCKSQGKWSFWSLLPSAPTFWNSMSSIWVDVKSFGFCCFCFFI